MRKNNGERIPKALSEGKRWLKQADEDLKTAEVLLEGARYYMVCFLMAFRKMCLPIFLIRMMLSARLRWPEKRLG